MKYFCTVNERKGTSYLEFYKGKWDNKTFWKSDSLLLDFDIYADFDLYKAFAAAIPGFDPHGVFEVNRSQWETVLDYASKMDTGAEMVLAEAVEWLKKL
ncbi:hypothetical protein [Thermoclostridium stercorarium]|uniref:hypothetical protein n=1 Tax=Thermoclostridium stercorarium TaxID=1510 RepID=UPI000A8DE8BA|nr:hypothetical protein [Thermoclostridium stercorarium]